MEKLSILMNSYNRPDIIDGAIQSILRSNLPDGLELEVVIVDDHSNEETWDIVRSNVQDVKDAVFPALGIS